MEIAYNPKPLTADQLRSLSQEVKQVLTELYGDRLDRVILYGSYARGDFHAESDVDYLVVLREETIKEGPFSKQDAKAFHELFLLRQTSDYEIDEDISQEDTLAAIETATGFFLQTETYFRSTGYSL